MSDIPFDSIATLVEYCWDSEEHHYEECLEDESENAAPLTESHIFQDIKIIREWLQSLGKLS